MKGYIKKAAAVLLCTAALSSCGDWERQQPIFQEETPLSQDTQPVFLPQEEKEGGEEELQESLKELPCVVAVTVVSTANKENTWQTQDDVLAQSVYDALQIKNEEYETLDIRPYDFDITFTTADEEKISWGIWINFKKDNNVIVQDSAGSLWDIPVCDSNRLRIVLTDLE